MMTLSYLWFSLDIPNLRLDVSWPMTLTYWPFTFVVLMSFNPRFRFINGCPTFQYILYFIISMFFFKFSRIVANKSYTKISQYTSLVYFFLELWDKNLLTDGCLIHRETMSMFRYASMHICICRFNKSMERKKYQNKKSK